MTQRDSYGIRTTYDGVAEQLVTQYKYGSQRPTAKSLASLMAVTSPQKLADYIVVPVPTATARVRERGFDHAVLLAKYVASELGLRHTLALRHVGQSRQVGSGRAMRIKQALESYRVSQPRLLAGKKILLVDDVVTTGATMQACARLLRKAGAKRVDGLAFARRL